MHSQPTFPRLSSETRRRGHDADDGFLQGRDLTRPWKAGPTTSIAARHRRCFLATLGQSRHGQAGWISISAMRSSASSGSPRRPRRRRRTGSGRSSTPAPARPATSRMAAAIRRRHGSSDACRCSSAGAAGQDAPKNERRSASSRVDQLSRSDLWHAAAGPRSAGPCRRGQGRGHLHRANGHPCRRRDRLAAQAAAIRPPTSPMARSIPTRRFRRASPRRCSGLA